MEKEKFSLKKGRKRPPYKPKEIRCPGCGAALTIKTERSEMVVCEYCASQLGVSATEQKVLGKGPGQKEYFPLNLGDSFQYRGARFEIISRMAFIEDNDPTDKTRQYLLYNPRRGPLWLDEYQGQYSISNDTHVMPKTDVFAKKRGDILETHDERKWITEGVGIYQLAYVDGALPWVAKTGDNILYAEFSEKSGSGMQYEVQKIGGEIEYGTGKALPLEVVRRATKKPDLGKETVSRTFVDAAKTRKFYISLMLFACVALVINGLLSLYSLTCGRVVLNQTFKGAQLSGEVYSDPFEVAKADNIIKISVTASPRLSNAWMAMDIALLESEDKVIHVYDNDIQYYHGVEGGESWSEGGQSKTAYIKIPRAGIYQLLLHAVSAIGNTPRATRSLYGASIRVKDGALMPHFFISAAILSALILIVSVVFYSKWKTADEGEE
jgi:ribosomal protein S27E